MKTLILALLLSATALASDEVQSIGSETRRLRIENAVLKVQNLDLQLRTARREVNDQVIAAAAEQKLNIDEYDFDFGSLVFRRKAAQQ